MKIMLLGGTRFIGPEVVKLSYANEHEIILFHRGHTTYPFNFSVQSIQDDRNNLHRYRSQIAALAPDVVIDMIAYSEADANEVIKTFAGIVPKIILVSSCDVYQAYDRLWNVISGPIIQMPINETAPLRTQFFPHRKAAKDENDWRYHYDKILVEQTLLACPDFVTTILRLPMVYGPRDYWRIQPYMKKIEAGKPILIDEYKTRWRFSRGYVEDIAYAIFLAAITKSTQNKIYNVGELYPYSEIEWIELIAKIMQCRCEIVPLPKKKLPVELVEHLAWEQHLILDSQLIRDDLNYRERFEVGAAILKTINWLRQESSVEQS